jgi:dUTP pyrophosphatase
MKIKIFRKNKSVSLPERKSEKAAGLDIYSAEDIEIPSGKVTLVDTGLIIQIPEGFHIKLYLRSGFAVKNNISLVNDTGIIDEDYCGEKDYIKIAVVRHLTGDLEADRKLVKIHKGDRIGQILFEKTEIINYSWDEQENAGFAGKSRGGFGSTGK